MFAPRERVGLVGKGGAQVTPTARALDYLAANPTSAAVLLALFVVAAVLAASGGWRPSGGGQR